MSHKRQQTGDRGKDIVVLYHGDCPDGFGGAWVAWKKFGSRARYVGLFDRKKLPMLIENKKEVYLIDWIYDDPNIMKGLCRDNKRVIGIDHHIGVKKILENMPGSVFDTTHSGAMLAWKYFFPKRKPPQLLRYVEDYDIWKFALKDTAAVANVISGRKMDFEEWSKLARELENPASRKRIIETGRILLAEKKRIVLKLAGGAEPVILMGYKVFAANSPVFRNEIGHELALRKPPFAIIWWQEGKQMRISFRANKPFNLLTALKKLRARGHPQAASIIWPLNKPLPWRRTG